MSALGVVVAILGLVGLLLDATGLIAAVPGLGDQNIPRWVWIAVVVAGTVLYILTRRPRD